MLQTKCLAQGLRMVVTVTLLPAAPTTTLFTPSVPTLLSWGHCCGASGPDLLSLL